MTEVKLRWGILGTANIARKNWQAIRHSGNGLVAAVASRDAGRSRQFVTDCQAQVPFERTPQALGSYEELLASPDVDAVYIPLPTGLRSQWVIRAAEAGKHVVAEKPCAVSVVDCRKMLDACRQHRVQYMDGVMFSHSRRLDAIRQTFGNDAGVGQLKRIASAFSFPGNEQFLTVNIRMHSGLEPFGCLGDLGWYCIRFTLWAMNGQLPRGVTGRILSQRGGANSPAPVPTEFSGELLFDGGVSAGFYCSFVTEHQQWAHVSGTKGCLEVSDFVLPFFGSEVAFEVHHPMFRFEGCNFNMEQHTRRIAIPEYSNSHPTAQESNLFRTFADQIPTGGLRADWPDIALKTQQIMEACLASARTEGRLVDPAREIS